MAVTNFIQSIWSKKIQDDLELKCKLVDNCLRDYEGDVKHAASVKILGVGEPTIGAYDSGVDITIEEMSDRGQMLTIDQANYFAFYVDDINQAQSVPGLAEKYQQKAVHGLAVKRDEYVANLIAGATNVTIATDNPAEGVKEAIDSAIVALRERNFDEEGVIEITPAVYNVFKNHLITLSTNNPEILKKGAVGKINHAYVCIENCLPEATDGGAVYNILRTEKAVAFAEQIEKVEHYRPEDAFTDAVKGLYVFGAKIVRPEEIYVMKTKK